MRRLRSVLIIVTAAGEYLVITSNDEDFA